MKHSIQIRLLTLLLMMSICSFVSAQCELDTIAPIAQTVSIATVLLAPDSYEAKIFAIDYFLFVSDECTPVDSMRYTFSNILPDNDPSYVEEYMSGTRVFYCNDVINSPVVIDVYAWDLADNYFMYSVEVSVVPSNNTSCQSCLNDTIPPEITVLDDLVTLISEDSMTIGIWASDFILSAFDGCTPSDSLEYTFWDVPLSQNPNGGIRNFDCFDIANSPIQVEVYVWDSNENYSMGTSLIDIQSNSNGCLDSFVQVNGTITLLDGDAAKGAVVNLEDEMGEILQTTLSNNKGEYTIYTDSYSHYISVEYDDNTTPVVSALDLFIMQRHLLGLYSFEPNQLLAADVNSDNRLRVDDMRLMRKFILGIIDINQYLDTSWQFVGKSHDLSDTQRGRISLLDNPNPDFIGYRMGDVR